MHIHSRDRCVCDLSYGRGKYYVRTAGQPGHQGLHINSLMYMLQAPEGRGWNIYASITIDYPSIRLALGSTAWASTS